MIPGLYAAATGMMTVEDRQSVIANNIANASTAGFRSQTAVQKGFYSMFVKEMSRPFRFNVDVAPGGGVKLDETFTDVSSGPVTTTGDPLNVALHGPGFIVVDTPAGERFTRNGKLTVDVDGQLATADGLKIQSVERGAIDAGRGILEISRDGIVKVNGVRTGQIRLVEFEDPHMLMREGNHFYVASEAALGRSAASADTVVIQKSLEMSNVNLPREMINMILGLRAYAANQKMINAIDETWSRLIDQVGMPI